MLDRDIQACFQGTTTEKVRIQYRRKWALILSAMLALNESELMRSRPMPRSIPEASLWLKWALGRNTRRIHELQSAYGSTITNKPTTSSVFNNIIP